MSMHSKGLTKLQEECAELIQIAAKKAAYITSEEHPDEAGPMKDRLENEMGDVMAAIGFVIDKLELDSSRVEERAAVKFEQYTTWDKE